ncbi:hypothetical protein JTB14_007557 [Gonioctena quinquepunctata]|nr:hypothetical protein JTB14_007557 [Gonioctena quinquepunctata]
MIGNGNTESTERREGNSQSEPTTANIIREVVNIEDIENEQLDMTINSPLRRPKHNPLRQDRIGQGGGVELHMNKKLKHKVLLQDSRDSVEQVWIETPVSGNKNNRNYLSTNVDSLPFINFFEDVLTEFPNETDDIIVFGDFNVNMLRDNPKRFHT